jgi:hypothetical protein
MQLFGLARPSVPPRNRRHSFAVLYGVGLALLSAGGCGDAGSGQGPAITEAKSDSLPDDEQLKKNLDEVLDFTFQRNLDVETNAAWQIVHGIMAFGPKYQIYVKGELAPGLDYLLKGGALRGWNFRRGEKGLQAILEGGTKTGQGHQDQWLGYLSHCELTPDQTIVVDGETYTIANLLDQSCWECRQGQEASWTLMGLSSNLPTDATWQAADGQAWSQERLVEMEAAQDLNASACGGTHRLYGLTMALRRHQEQHPQQPLSGGWLAADERIRWAVEQARANQQPDGSFSTAYFQRPATSNLVLDKLGSTGHTLEFLTLALDDGALKEPWVTRAAAYLCKLMRQTRDQPLECGALFHAAHGLHLYRLRRFGPRTYGDAAESLAAENATPPDEGTDPSPPPTADLTAATGK